MIGVLNAAPEDDEPHTVEGRAEVAARCAEADREVWVPLGTIRSGAGP